MTTSVLILLLLAYIAMHVLLVPGIGHDLFSLLVLILIALMQPLVLVLTLLSTFLRTPLIPVPVIP